MTLRIVSDNKFDTTRPLHTCNVCGKRGNWGPDWMWYGSILDWDNGVPLWITCSDACKDKSKHVPRFMRQARP